MPIKHTCPRGHTMLVREEHLGQKIRCPTCKQVMILPGPGKPQLQEAAVVEEPVPALVPDEPTPKASLGPKKRRRERGEQTEKVRVGLMIHIARLLVWILGAGAGGLVALTVGAKAAEPIQYVVGPIGAVLGITGSIFCCYVPRSSGCRGAILAVVVMETIVLLGSLVTIGVPLTEIEWTSPDKTVLLLLLPASVLFASQIMFCLFLKGLAAYVNAPELEAEAIQVLLIFVGFIGVLFLVVVLGGWLISAAGEKAVAPVQWFSLLIIGVYLILYLVRYLYLLMGLRENV